LDLVKNRRGNVDFVRGLVGLHVYKVNHGGTIDKRTTRAFGSHFRIHRNGNSIGAQLSIRIDLHQECALEAPPKYKSM
jgi:hypothetical protein